MKSIQNISRFQAPCLQKFIYGAWELEKSKDFSYMVVVK